MLRRVRVAPPEGLTADQVMEGLQPEQELGPYFYHFMDNAAVKAQFIQVPFPPGAPQFPAKEFQGKEGILMDQHVIGAGDSRVGSEPGGEGLVDGFLSPICDG